MLVCGGTFSGTLCHDDVSLNVLFVPFFVFLWSFKCTLPFCCSQGLDEEALVDHGKSSFSTQSNYGGEDLESKFHANKTELFFLSLICFCFFK